MKRLIPAIACCLCVLLSSATTAQTPAQWDKAWGPYAHAAGRTALSDSGNTKARWYWVEPGKSLMQEYRRAKDDLVFRETLITLGSEPGTLVMAPRPVGMAPETPYVAVLQADGRLFLPHDAQTPLTGNLLEVSDAGGVLVYSAARISDGRAVPNPADKRKYLRFPLDPAPAAVVVQPQPDNVVASAPPAAARAAPGASAESGVAGQPATAPVAARPVLSAATVAERMTHWGKWGEHVGKTLRIYFITPTGFDEVATESCTWVQPGVEMTCLETDAVGERTVRYALGLDNRIRAFGITGAGHVVWDRYDDGSFATSYTADDGTPVSVRTMYDGNGRVTAWVTQGTRSGLLAGVPDDPAGSAAASIAQVADAVRAKQKPAGEIAGSVAASATAPLVGEAEAATLQTAWGPLSVLAGGDWVQHYLGFAKRQFPTRFSWVVPGRVLQAVNRDGTAVYRLAPDGTIVYTPPEAAEDRSERTLYPRAGGALMEYMPPPLDVVQYIDAHDKRTRYFTYLEPNGQVSKWMHSPGRPDLGVASSVFVRMDGSTGPGPEVLGAALRNPAAWGPLAALANRTVTTNGHPTIMFSVAEGGDMMHMLNVGFQQATPRASLAIGPSGTIVRRDKSTHQGRDIGSFKEGHIVDGTTVEWRYPGRAMDDFLIDHTWTVVAGEYDTTFTVGFPDGPGLVGEQKVELLRIDPKLLAPALAYLQGTSRGIAATVQAKANEYIQRTSGNGTNQFLGAVSRALDVGNAYANEAAARSRAELDATIARVNAQAAQATQAAPSGGSQIAPAGNPVGSPGDRRGVDRGVGSTFPAPPAAAKQCRTVTKTYSRRSMPKPSIAEARDYLAKFPSSCHLGAPPNMGPADCSEDSEPIVTKDAQGIPRVTGRQTLYTCEVVLTCPATEVCEGESTGASAQ